MISKLKLGLLYFVLLITAISSVQAITLNELFEVYSNSSWFDLDIGTFNVTGYNYYGIDTGESVKFDYLVINLTTTGTGERTVIGSIYNGDELVGTSEVITTSNNPQLNFTSEILRYNEYNLSIKIIKDGSIEFKKEKEYPIAITKSNYEDNLNITSNSYSNLPSDVFTVNATLTRNWTASYATRLSAYLKNGTKAVEAKSVTNISTNNISINFSKDELRKAHFYEDGYFNGDLLIFLEIDGNLIDTGSGINVNEANSFQTKDIAFNYTVFATTVNQSEKIKELIYNIGVDVVKAEVYDILFSMENSYDEQVVDVSKTFNLTAGKQILQIPINGTSIYESGINGPYRLGFIAILKNNQTIDYLQPSYTVDYTYDQFTPPEMVDIEINSSDIVKTGNNLSLNVHNLGAADAVGISVVLFDNNTGFIDEKLIDILRVGENKIVKFTNKPTTKAICYVDFDNLIEEINESNNLASEETPVAPNNPPAITTSAVNSNWHINMPFVFDVNANDADAGDVLTFSDNLMQFAINPVTGMISFTPNALEAINGLIFVCDDSGAANNCTNQIFTLNVGNNAPVLNPIGNKIITEDQTLTITLSAADTDGDSLTYSTNATKGSLAGSVFTWKPSLTDSGNYSVLFDVTDSYATDSEVIHIEVLDYTAPVTPPSNTTPTIPPTITTPLASQTPSHIKLPNTAYDNEDLTASPNSNNYIYKWFRNGAIQNSMTSPIVQASYTAIGDKWKYEVWSAASVTTVFVGGKPMVITNPSAFKGTGEIAIVAP